MLIELPVFWIVTLNVCGWLVLQLGLAWMFTQMPAAWFNPGPPRTWERSGEIYERCCAIKRWKDWLPDAASWFAEGFAKGTLIGMEPEYLARFIRETWRGELCHWLALCCVPLFVLWNPWWGDLIIVAYALAANFPCILVQRYNRLRLARMQAARTLRNKREKGC
jgi:glycosyl-4,4'-diaponeurosporenoate acyltransferase